MKVHLKDYPCNNGETKKGEPYTVNKSDVNCKDCLNPKKSKPEKEKPKGEVKEETKK